VADPAITDEAPAAAESAAASLRALRETLPAGGSVPLGDILDQLGAHGLGVAMLLLGAASLVPGPAPLFGAALCAVGVGMALSRDTVMLPSWLRRRGVRTAHAHAIIDRVLPIVTRLERLLRPRWHRFARGGTLRLVGVACLVDGILIVLPIPFGNAAPALSVLVLSLGIVVHDGAAVVVGLAVTVIAFTISVALVALGYETLGWLLNCR
jgi:hypothetical protein